MTTPGPDAAHSTDPGTAPTLPPPALPLRTTRLVLRPIVPEDRAALGYYRDPEVCRYLPFPPTDEEGLTARVERMAAAVTASVPGDSLAVGVEHDGALIGDVTLRLQTRTDDHSPPSVAEVGWVFAPTAGGRGLATEAARALVDLAFEHYPLHRLYANLDPRNTRSSALCERLGMTAEAHLRRDWPEPDGTWTDSAIYGLLREEWAARAVTDG